MNHTDAVGTTRPDPPPRRWYLDQLARDVGLIATALADAGALDQSVHACPGWDLRQLIGHLGSVHRWAAYAVQHGRPAPAELEATFLLAESDEPVPWFLQGADRLIDVLEAVDADTPTWHPWPAEQIAAFWPRRQMQETSIHRWDVQSALGTPDGIDVAVAADGIDEWFALAVPRRLLRDGVPVPAGRFHVHCTDVAGEWLAWSDNGEYRMVRAHLEGDAALRGPADAINLTLWGRTATNDAELAALGDATVLAAWRNFGGV